MRCVHLYRLWWSGILDQMWSVPQTESCFKHRYIPAVLVALLQCWDCVKRLSSSRWLL